MLSGWESGLNYSWRLRERSCKSLNFYFSAPRLFCSLVDTEWWASSGWNELDYLIGMMTPGLVLVTLLGQPHGPQVVDVFGSVSSFSGLMKVDDHHWNAGTQRVKLCDLLWRCCRWFLPSRYLGGKVFFFNFIFFSMTPQMSNVLRVMNVCFCDYLIEPS